MAVEFFMIQKPDCMENLGVFNVAAAKSFAAPDNIRGTTKAVVSAGATGLRRLTKNMQEITKF